jgi:hypothetical protein
LSRDAIIELVRIAEKRTQMGRQGSDWVERRFSAWAIGKEFESPLESDA